MPISFKAVAHGPFARYAFAIVIVIASFLLRLALVKSFGLEFHTFMVFYPAVLLVAVLAGLWPGFLASALIVLGVEFLVVPPIGSFWITSPSDAISLVLFVGICVFTNLLIERYRRSERLNAAYKAEQAHRNADLQYRTLFNTIDEGFCVLEIIFDSAEKPVDCRFIEVNAVFEKQSGLREAAGKRVRELVPSIEDSWAEIYGNVALTGEPIHFVDESRALNRHFEVRAYRVGEPARRRVAVVFSDVSERKQAEEEKKRLLEAARHERDTLSAVINAMKDEVWLFDSNEEVILLNSSAPNQFGHTSKVKTTIKALTKNVEIRRPDGSLIPFEEAPPFRALHGEIIRNEEETLRVTTTGELRYREVNAAPLRDATGKIIGAVSVVHDITKRKEAETRIRKLNRLYTVLSGISETIVRVKDTNAMLEAACRIAVDEGKFRMAWIGLINPETQIIEPVASCGAVDGYLDQLKIDVSNPVYATGPGVQCILSGTHAICNDIENDPQYLIWRDEALRRGFRSSASFPLTVSDQIVGVLCLYSVESGFFEGDELSLLDKLAMDISFALEVNLREVERRKAEAHIVHLNRVYTVLSEINQTIVRENDSQVIVEAACRIAIEKGKFRMAWIGMIDPITRELKPIASNGVVDGYLDQVKIDLINPDPAPGPVARCLQSGEHSICNDFERDFSRPWKNDALNNGYRSMAAFPLWCEGKLVGVFTLYAGETAFFDKGETQLLDELSTDISFALAVNRHEESRKKTEEDLRWQSAFFKAQVDSALDGILVVSAAGKRILQNKRLKDILRIPRDLFEGTDDAPLLEFVTKQMKDPGQFAEKVNYLETHPAEVSQDELELVDGSILERFSYPVMDETPSYYGRIWTFRDITSRKEAEISLRSKTALLEAQINATIDGTLVVDPVGRMILQNRRFFEIFKIPSEFRSNAEDRLAREHASNLVKDPEAFMARIDYLNAHPMETSSDEIELKDGTTLDRYSAPIVDDAGKYYGRIWTFRDITDRKESEIALKAKTALLEAQVNSSIDAIMVVDPSDQRILQNRRLFEVFKFPIELQMDSEGSRAREHVKTQVKDPDAFTSKHAHLIAHPMEISQDEIELKDGTILDRSSSPVVGDDGKYYGRIWTLRDISGRRKLEEQYRQSQKMEAIGQLTGGIAHDFNNLLAVIIGNLDLLERQIKGNEPAVKRVHTARKASLRGADLTRRLLAFSRQEVLHPSAVDLNAVIGSVLALAAPVLGPEIQIITRLDPSIPAVFADASGLENALLNLIVNARDAMSKRGKLTITSELRNLESDESLEKDGDLKPGGYAYVAISDNGHGMTKEVAQKVFEPFFTTKSHGTGLGLSMVYGFLKQSNGTIRVYSEPGFGTTLSFLLPLFEGNVNLPSAPILEKRSADVARSTILIVDDEADLLEIASTCLTNLGHTVLTAMDGKSARQLIEERDDIALLLTDIIMPGDMTGVELAECALKIKPSLKVIYCSGFPTEALAERNMSLAEGSLLRKPYQSSELISIVSNAFASAPLVQAIKVPSFPNR